ncbi:hypothetical protein L7F22_049112 [Adiantum nelumboides]|nr:hypothetical protein [Adiantum nelumboides]
MWSVKDAAVIFGTLEDRLRTWAHEIVSGICRGFSIPWVDLPSGGKLSPRGLQLLGLSGLGSSGGFERLHYLLERAWDPVLVQGTPKRLSSTFLRMFENWLSFDTNPLYALMHESIYCQGAASNWAAHRIRDEFRDQFDAVKAAKSGGHVFFTGEMVFPWMFDEFTALKPLKELANFLATKKDWPPLYNETALKSNQAVPLEPYLLARHQQKALEGSHGKHYVSSSLLVISVYTPHR